MEAMRVLFGPVKNVNYEKLSPQAAIELSAKKKYEPILNRMGLRLK